MARQHWLRSIYKWSKNKDEEEAAEIRAFNSRVFHLRSGSLTLVSLDEQEHFSVRFECDPALFERPRHAGSLVASASAVLGTPCIGEIAVAVHPSGGHDVQRDGRPGEGTLQVDGVTFGLDADLIEIAGRADESGLVAVRGEVRVRIDRPPLETDEPWTLSLEPEILDISLKMRCTDDATVARFTP